MREEVRAWILARPALVRQLRGADAGPLLVAAPYLRIDGDRWQLPGGPAAAPIWLAVAGVTSDAPEPLLLALLRADGLPAYMLEVVATLDRRAAARGAVARGRRRQPPRRRRPGAARRPARRRARLGPSRAAVLAAVGRSGLPPRSAARRRERPAALPGGRLFWTLVFGDGAVVLRDAAARSAWDDPTPVSAGWLVSRIWIAAPAEQPIRYEQVLFASRWLARGRRVAGGRGRDDPPRLRALPAAPARPRSPGCRRRRAASPRWSIAPTAWRRPRPTGAATRRWCAGRARSSSSIT